MWPKNSAAITSAAEQHEVGWPLPAAVVEVIEWMRNWFDPAVISFWVIMAASLASVYSFYDRIIIFATCLGVNMVADVGKVMGAGYIGKKLSDRVILIINRVSGVLYLIFGFAILAGIIYTLVKH